MIKYIKANKQWIFSGIGVLALSLLIGSVKFLRFGANVSEGSKEEPAISQEEAVVQTMRRYSSIQRISVGDFHIFKGRYRPIRVQVLGIKRSPVADVMGSRQEEDVAHLEVDLGGALISGGMAASNVGVNSYLVPALDQSKSLGPPEPERCLFHFSTQESAFSFSNVCVTHINPREQTVDVGVQEVKSQ